MSKKKKSQKQKLSQAPLLKQEVSESASEVEKESVSPETQPESGQDDNKSSHEAFLDAYQRREQYDLGAGYAEWLKSNGSKTDASYAAAVKDATLAYDRALEGYGAKGEKLAGLGLDEGGYSAYLSSQRAHVRDAALAHLCHGGRADPRLLHPAQGQRGPVPHFQQDHQADLLDGDELWRG